MSRTYAIFEAVRVSLTGADAVELADQFCSFFATECEDSWDVSFIYVHDFVNSINSYFTSDFEDCIRQIVTSAENFFETRGWRAKQPLPETLLRRLLLGLMCLN